MPAGMGTQSVGSDWTRGPGRIAASVILCVAGAAGCIAALGRGHADPVFDRSGVVAAAGGQINVNTAGTQELEALPGIGPTLARRIVQDRDRRGPFHRVDDLARVPGIGPAKVERLRPFVLAR